MCRFGKQKARVGFIVIANALLLVMPSVYALGTSTPLNEQSSFLPFTLNNIQQAIGSCKTANNTNSGSNLNMTNAIDFVTPDLSMLYPVQWNASVYSSSSEIINSIVTFNLTPQYNSSSENMAALNIAKHSQIPEIIKMEEYVGSQIYFLRNTIPGFYLIRSQNATLDGRNAYWAIYNGLEGPKLTTTLKVWVESGSDRYILTYSADPQNFPCHLNDAENIIGSVKISGAQAPLNLTIAENIFHHLPSDSQERLLPFISDLVAYPVFDYDLNNFIEGYTDSPPKDFTKAAAYPEDNTLVYYRLVPAYNSPKGETPELKMGSYKLLELVFKDSTSNRIITGRPIDYEVTVNGTNFNFNESGTTSTGLDVKIITGKTLEQFLENPQQYSIKINILH